MAMAPAAAAFGLLLRLSLCLDLAPAAQVAWVERRLAVMGTFLGLGVEGADRASALAASEAAAREISRVEDLLSTWKPGGPLNRLNGALPGESVALGGEAAAVLSEVFDWSDRTGGAFDATVLPLVSAWDLRGVGRVPGDRELSRALAATGRSQFRVDAAGGRASRLSALAGIDEGAWGKGYALDCAAAVLRQGGTRRAVIDLGGQVLALGETVVAVADPRSRGRATVTLRIANASVSTSGNSERGLTVGGRRIGHLLDPHTGAPAPDFGSATVIASSGFTADVLSTALFVLGPDRGLALSAELRRKGFENQVLFLVVTGDRLRTVASPDLSFHFEEP